MKKACKCIVVMGVSGCGKSTVGSAVANHLRVPFLDADDFHSSANRKKMERGIPLTDADRMPWLELLAKELTNHSMSKGAVLACSALKKKYRDKLKSPDGNTYFVYLKGELGLISERMKRRDHFMPVTLLQSQFDALEEPTESEAITISIEQTVDEQVKQIIDQVQ